MPIHYTPIDGLDWGSVLQSTNAGNKSYNAFNTEFVDFMIDVTPGDARFTSTPTGVITIPARSTQAIVVNFTSDVTLGPVDGTTAGDYPLSADVVPPTIPAWNIVPTSIDFGRVKIGTTTATTNVTVTNTGSVALTIDTITSADPSQFVLGSLPSFPFVLGVGLNLVFTVECTSTTRGLNDYPLGIVVTPSLGSPQSVELMYTGYLLDSVFILTGATQGVLFGLAGIWNHLPNVYIAQSLASLPCEADASWTKMHDFGSPSDYTYTNRFFMRTECFGVVTATLSSIGVISDQVTTHTDTKVRNSSNDSLGIPTNMIFDLETNGEIHKLQLTVLANEGILSLIYYIPTYETRGSVYEAS